MLYFSGRFCCNDLLLKPTAENPFKSNGNEIFVLFRTKWNETADKNETDIMTGFRLAFRSGQPRLTFTLNL